jgi:molecular chaperone DnaJ
VSSSATRDEIRIAYRKLARAYHPDARGADSELRMAQINEAWRVLSDPARRAVYDDAAARRTTNGGPGQSAGQSAATATAPWPDVRVAPTAAAEPARFPWRFMVVLATLGIAFVLVNAALTKPSDPPPPDNMVGPGSCVDIEANGDAREVPCDGNNQGVVVALIDLDGICPPETEGHRDHQGLGQVCVRMAASG